MTTPEPIKRAPGECAFPACDCPGEEPVCEDYEISNETVRLGRIVRGRPTCSAYIAAGL